MACCTSVDNLTQFHLTPCTRGRHGLFHLYISVILCTRGAVAPLVHNITPLHQCYIMHQGRHRLFHLYISVISCTRGATGCFTFTSVLYHAPGAPQVVSPLHQCYIMHQGRHRLFHLYISVISSTRGATGCFTFTSVLYHAPGAPQVVLSSETLATFCRNFKTSFQNCISTLNS